MRKIFILLAIAISLSTSAQVRWWKTASGATTWDTAYYDGTERYGMFLIRLPIGTSSQTPPTPPSCQAWVHLPPPHVTWDRIGLIIDLHGSGEASRLQESVANDKGAYARRLFKNSLPKFIMNGGKPYGINAEGDTMWYIVVCPQTQEANNSSYSRTQLDDMIPVIFDMFKFNRRHAHLTGLSRGGAGTWSPVLGDSILSHKFASISPRAAEGYSIGDGVNFSQYIRRGGGIYMSMGNVDAFYSNANAYDDAIVARNPLSGQYYYHVVSGAGHSGAVWDGAIEKGNLWWGGLNWWDRIARWQRQYDTVYAWAGLRDTVTTTSVTLSGEDEHETGKTITGRAWTRVAGPSATITNGNTATPTINGLSSNQYYKFRYTVTQSDGKTASDDVEIWTVNTTPPANLPPVSNAGPDQTITFPSMSVSLSGSSSTDPDGSIVSYAWTKTSGPAGGSFSASSSVNTNFTVTNAGTYTLSLTVTDNGGATATDQVLITFNSQPAPSTPDVKQVVVSEYKVAIIKKDSTAWGPYFIGGTGTKLIEFAGGHKFVDGDGGLYNILLRKANGDLYSTRNSDTQLEHLDSTATGLFQAIDQECYLRTYIAINKVDSQMYARFYNTYKWFGSNENLILNQWTLIPGQPAGVKFIKVHKGGETGSGQLIGVTKTGSVWILPDNSTTWTQKTFPVPIADIHAGHYGFYIAIGNDSLPYGWGEGAYLGLSPGNISTYQPLASAWGFGSRKILKMGVNDNTIHYILTDNKMYALGDNAMGLIGNGQELVNRKEVYKSGYWYVWDWLKVTQPGYNSNYLVSTPYHVTPGRLYSNVWAGNYYSHYKFAQELGTGDVFSWGRNKGSVLLNGIGASNESAFPNTMDVLVPTKVNPWAFVTPTPSSFIPGTVNAGLNQTISAGTTTISATATAGGTSKWSYSLSSYEWTKITGPSCVIASPLSASTVVSGMSNGTYSFQFKVTDNNGATYTDTVLVTVTGSGNMPPVVDAGANQTTSNGTITMAGSATDGDGSISFYSWSQISGPNSALISDESNPATTISGLIPGTYVFQLQAIDEDGASSTDQVIITITPGNSSPYVFAGFDNGYTSFEFSLFGSAFDGDGNISFQEWGLVSGPEGAVLLTPNSQSTKVTVSAPGNYIFRLTAFDNSGSSAFDEVEIKVTLRTYFLIRGRKFTN